jgi:hypothetical protein
VLQAILYYLGLCKYTFAQRRNRLTTRFSEHIPVVKRRISAYFWEWAYVSQQYDLWMRPRGVSFPNCSQGARHTAQHAEKLPASSRWKDSQKWDALQQPNHHPHAVATAYSIPEQYIKSVLCTVKLLGLSAKRQLCFFFSHGSASWYWGGISSARLSSVLCIFPVSEVHPPGYRNWLIPIKWIHKHT